VKEKDTLDTESAFTSPQRSEAHVIPAHSTTPAHSTPHRSSRKPTSWHIKNAIDDSSFYANLDITPEIVQGILAEKQILALGGDYGVGKTPFLEDMIVCITNGIPFCGRQTLKRPVIAVDFESNAAKYKRTLLGCARRYGVEAPKVPEELDAYLALDDCGRPTTKKLQDAMASADPLRLIRGASKRNPTQWFSSIPRKSCWSWIR